MSTYSTCECWLSALMFTDDDIFIFVCHWSQAPSGHALQHSTEYSQYTVSKTKYRTYTSMYNTVDKTVQNILTGCTTQFTINACLFCLKPVVHMNSRFWPTTDWPSYTYCNSPTARCPPPHPPRPRLYKNKMYNLPILVNCC